MSFNNVVLIIAAIIFVILLSVFGVFIYNAQKKKYNIYPASCPDYWTLSTNKDGSTSCIPNPLQINWGGCNNTNQAGPYNYNTSLTKPCDIFLDKSAWVTNPTNCSGTILWDGVTNNDDYLTSCKPAPTSS